MILRSFRIGICLAFDVQNFDSGKCRGGGGRVWQFTQDSTYAETFIVN
jgi:hypothetical protein